MIPTTLIDLIFRGGKETVDFSFLENLIGNSRYVRVDYPQDIEVRSYQDFIKTIRTYDDWDIVVVTDNFDINNVKVANAFINLSKTEASPRIELLFYFDLRDMQSANMKENIDFLRTWALNFAPRYSFDYMSCRMDAGNEDESYFDLNGVGPFYSLLEE